MKKIPLLLLTGSLIILQACGGDSNTDSDRSNSRFGGGQRQQATSVETMPVTRADISNQIRSYGNIQAQDVVEVTPQVSNRITRIHADLGDTVRQGDLLAEIYEVPYRDAYQQAQAQLRQSQANFERDSLQFVRQKQLYDKELISASEFNNAKATYENSRASVEANRASLTQSREDLNNTDIRSPVYGVVLSRNISEGDVAGTGTAVYEIANLTGLETRVYLPVEEWEQVAIGQEVSFRLSNRNNVTARGRVSRISPQLDPTTGLGEVVISLTSRGPGIHQGVLVESIINVETNNQSVVIPRSALVENVQTLIEPESNTIQLSRTYSVFVVQGDSLAVKRELELGIEQGDRVEIVSGLQSGDQIVITGQAGLEDSTRVQVADAPRFQRGGEVPIQNTGMSPEQRERFRNADDSTRQAMRQRMQQRRQQQAAQDTSSTNNSSN